MLLSRRMSVFTPGCVIVTLALPAIADAPTDARKAIQAAYDHVSAAIEKKDVKAVLANYTPDFQMIEKGGVHVNIIQSRLDIQSMFNMLKSARVSQSVQNLTLKGNQALVTEKTHMEGTILDPQTNRPRKFVGDNVSEDIWVKGAKGWQLKRSKTLNERTILDGKPQP